MGMVSRSRLTRSRRWAPVALVLLAGCNSMTGTMNNEVGKNYYKAGNYTMAKDEFQRAVINDPDNADYIHNLAAAHKKQGQVGEAERLYRHAINVNPEHQPSYHSLALLLNEQGRQGETFAMLQEWKETQPYNAEPYVELAWMNREQGQLGEAESLLHQALRIRPNDPIASAQLGQIYEDTGQKDRALAMYQRSRFSQWNQPRVESRMTALMRENPQISSIGSAVYAPTPWTTSQNVYPQAQIANYPLPNYADATGGLPTTVITERPIAPVPEPGIQIGAPIPTPGGPQISTSEPLVQPF